MGNECTLLQARDEELVAILSCLAARRPREGRRERKHS